MIVIRIKIVATKMPSWLAPRHTGIDCPCFAHTMSYAGHFFGVLSMTLAFVKKGRSTS